MKLKNIKFSFYIFKFKVMFIYLLLFLLFFIFGIKNNYIIKFDFLKKVNQMSLVIPIKYRDFEKIKRNFKYHKMFIKGIKNLVFIGNEKVGKLIKKNQFIFQIPLKFINEKVLIDVGKVKKIIKKRNKFAAMRSGWYIQQFLKMQYYRICQDNYYLIWDSDTIPVKEVKMFNNYSKPYLDVKTEYHKPYFITMKKIFPELEKKNNYSFISEHMLIKTKIMKILINRININKNISGDTWYEKIINCINKKDLPKSGFSEFETYGTFVNKYFNKTYIIRHWKSLRRGNKYYNPNNLTSSNILNISKDYSAVSFEKRG